MKKKAYLLLENGRVFEGTSFGADTGAVGELVFSTAMTGYLETLTDPNYCGQIVVQTFPLIGNYGITPDAESDHPHLSAYIVREWCQEPSNFRCEGVLDAFLKEHNIPAIEGIDTRALTRILREEGTMNAKIVIGGECPSPDESLKSCKLEGAVAKVAPTEVSVEGEGRKVVLWSFGAKKSVAGELIKRGCEVTTVPASFTAEQVLALEPQGVVISDGPGDPRENAAAIEEIRKLLASGVAVFGMGLGHQLIALANGAEVEKLHHGHRGANIPVRDNATGRVYITAQNHGYTVSSLPNGAEPRFVNVNDKTCEGIEYGKKCLTVQFTPGTYGGNIDTAWVYDKFIEMCEEVR